MRQPQRLHFTYSIRPEIHARSLDDASFQLEQIRYRNATGSFEREVVDLSRIGADAVVADTHQWAADFRERWASRFDHELDYAAARSMIGEIVRRSGFERAADAESGVIIEVLNASVALATGSVIGKGSQNLPSQINAHLQGRHAGPVAVAAVKLLLERYQPQILNGTVAYAGKVPAHIARSYGGTWVMTV